ncbi:MAG: hypothetical protein ACI8T1_001078 [Verrucomicrobiales bacterium]
MLGPDRVLLWPNETLRLTGLVYDLKEGPERFRFSWQEAAVNKTVQFSDPTYPGTDVTFPGPGIYELILEAADGVSVSRDRFNVTVQDRSEPSTGGILREIYTEISGYRVSNLVEASVFPDKPTFRDTLRSLDTPVDWTENYGMRLRGYVRVPKTSDYTFYITSDDASELRLNLTGCDPTGKERVAFTDNATGRYCWD